MILIRDFLNGQKLFETHNSFICAWLNTIFIFFCACTLSDAERCDLVCIDKECEIRHLIFGQMWLMSSLHESLLHPTRMDNIHTYYDPGNLFIMI